MKRQSGPKVTGDPTDITTVEATWMIAGTTISRTDCEALEESVAAYGDDLESRCKLIGYYCAHLFCCEDSASRRIPHILWLIAKSPFFGGFSTAFIGVDLLDSESYNAIRPAWSKALREFANDDWVLGNAASFIAFHEPEEAERLYLRAAELELQRWQPLLRLHQFSMPERLEASIKYKDHKRPPFQEGSAQCPHAKE